MGGKIQNELNFRKWQALPKRKAMHGCLLPCTVIPTVGVPSSREVVHWSLEAGQENMRNLPEAYQVSLSEGSGWQKGEAGPCRAQRTTQNPNSYSQSVNYKLYLAMLSKCMGNVYVFENVFILFYYDSF